MQASLQTSIMTTSQSSGKNLPLEIKWERKTDIILIVFLSFQVHKKQIQISLLQETERSSVFSS